MRIKAIGVPMFALVLLLTNLGVAALSLRAARGASMMQCSKQSRILCPDATPRSAARPFPH